MEHVGVVVDDLGLRPCRRRSRRPSVSTRPLPNDPDLRRAQARVPVADRVVKSVLFSVLGVRAAFAGEELGPEVGVSVVAPDLERDEVVEFVVAVLGVGDAVPGEDPVALGGRDVAVTLGPPGDVPSVANPLRAVPPLAGPFGALTDSFRP